MGDILTGFQLKLLLLALLLGQSESRLAFTCGASTFGGPRAGTAPWPSSVKLVRGCSFDKDATVRPYHLMSNRNHVTMSPENQVCTADHKEMYKR